MPYSTKEKARAYDKRRKHYKAGEAPKVPCGDPICPGVLEPYTHDTYPLARCTVCGEDFVIIKHRHSKRWSARPVLRLGA